MWRITKNIGKDVKSFTDENLSIEVLEEEEDEVRTILKRYAQALYEKPCEIYLTGIQIGLRPNANPLKYETSRAGPKTKSRAHLNLVVSKERIHRAFLVIVGIRVLFLQKNDSKLCSSVDYVKLKLMSINYVVL